MSVHAFIDESTRNGSYLLCVTIVEPSRLTSARKELVGLLLPGAREIHFKKEKQPRRRSLADRIAGLGIPAHVYTAPCTPRTEEMTRQRCLERAVRDLLEVGAHRLVFDSRDLRDRHDKVTLQRALGAHPSKTELTYEHMDSAAEPLLWISDTVAWCHGAGGDWRRRVCSAVARVIEL
ncbi:hypothetical protein [Amycolatopsis pigmentata]|uniref:DUF3800 domain-containing protein n=1 Tax=Amycolatopsis pigmentata TaxID=450801 RepID=A0ABW5G3Z6_9PSEU